MDEPSIIYNILLIIFLGLVIFGIVKGYGDNRTIIVFKNYDDLGLTFLVPASFFLVTYIFQMLGGNADIGFGLGAIVAIGLLGVLIRNTYQDNGQDVGKCLVALITKLPLGVFWVLNLINLLNPGGRTGTDRRRNRGQALVILTILTPIIGMLVVDKSGSYFNPRNWIFGRRVGPTIRNNL